MAQSGDTASHLVSSGANTRVSTTVPLSETHYEAMNFALCAPLVTNPDKKQHQQLDRLQRRYWQHSETEGGVTQL